MLSIIGLLFIVVGCSPGEKSIEKAVAKGDYQYIEKYLSNPKYWNDPNKSAVNAAAVEGLILLNRIDSAVALYKENKGKPSEEMIVKAFANALIKSKPQKMPEKLIELIDDNRNDASDTLLLKTTIEAEPSLAASKIKSYIERSKENRNTDANSSIGFINKAMAWDEKGFIEPPLKNLYSELVSLNLQRLALEADRLKVLALKKEADDLANEASEFFRTVLRQVVSRGGDINNFNATEVQEIQRKEDRLKDSEKTKKRELDALPKIGDIEKAIAEYEAKIKVKLQELEPAEMLFIEKLNAGVK